MKKFYTCFCFLLLSIASFGQQAFTGKVSDNNAQPIEGATVHLLNTNTGTSTDANGNFTLAGVSAGKYRLSVTAIGYASIQLDIALNESNEPLIIRLAEATTHLDGIVVTAQKAEEDMQKVPFSISALSSRKVTEFRLWNVKDITAIVPNLYSANPGDNRNVTSIRGITSTSYDPAVATYVDGVNQFSLDTYIAQLFDVERIEVLRGPQGTLYGRNAMAGVINVITKEPGNDFRGFVETTIGNYGQQRHAFGIRAPLVKNKLFLGVAGMYDANTGFYKNDFNNSEFDKKHNFTGNYYLKYLATSKLAFTLNVKHSNNQNNGSFPLAGSIGDALKNPYRVNQNAPTKLVDNIFNNSLNIQYAGQAFNFSALSTYQSNYRYYKTPIDGDFSPIDGITIINNYGKDWNNVKVLTQEIKFSSPASTSSPLKWTAGAYAFRQINPVKQATHFGEDAGFISDGAVPNSAVLNTSKGLSNGYAIFGQATYTFGKLDVTVGARYDYEHKKLKVHGDFLMDGMDEPVFVTQPDTTATTSFSAFSPKLSFAYHLNQNVSFYATGGRGFRAGGLTQLDPDPSNAPLYAYKPEYSFNGEVGAKFFLLDNRLQVNGALYYITVTDAQVPTLVLPQGITVTRNAGELTSKGMELEIAGNPVKGLHLSYAVGLTDATYETLNVSSNGNEVNLKGNRQIFTPKSTQMLVAQYDYHFSGDNKMRWFLRGEYMTIGTQYFDLGNDFLQSTYRLLNGRAGFGFKSFELSFWGRNLFDKKYISYAYNFGAANMGNPRNFGATLRWDF
jgi:iron complex outermembrane receptor protein